MAIDPIEEEPSVKTPPGLRPRRSPKQSRSQAIVEAIVQAGTRILEREGAKALTTTRIAEVAGVSVGSVYRYFPNKRAIVAAVYDWISEEEARRISDAERIVEGLSQMPVEEMIRRIVSVPLEAHRQKMALDGEFYRSNHPHFRWSQRLGSEQATEWIRRALGAHRARLRVRDLDAAAFLLARGVSSVLRAVVEERPQALEDEAFVESFVDLWIRFLVRDGEAGSLGSGSGDTKT